ncbi:MAG: hypothetical protein PVH10_07175, partial [Methyloceanibacter sp.]
VSSAFLARPSALSLRPQRNRKLCFGAVGHARYSSAAEDLTVKLVTALNNNTNVSRWIWAAEVQRHGLC